MKIWLDDIRPPPDGWTWAKSYWELRDAFDEYGDEITHVSFDNDLGPGPNNPEGWECAKWLLNAYLDGTITQIITLSVHSANVPASRRIQGYIEDIKKFYRLRNTSWTI